MTLGMNIMKKTIQSLEATAGSWIIARESKGLNNTFE